MIGRTIGNYRIEARLGVGGMGEVYRAVDTRLGREVAVKTLPEAFTKDPTRRARFEREARLLALLNHPNIGAIHGLEEADGAPFLILELVPGETIADRLIGGPIRLTETLEICRQIAEALEAAHEKGVVHRDLKPANIKVTPEGKVKVLDFGIAKALATEQMAENLSETPTMTMGATEVGVIIGSAPYMSPEQARGKPFDKRADIWAFGCLLYEMLAGRKAFPGETPSDHIALILTHDPDWDALPPTVPENIRTLLRRCLRKEASQRMRDAGDARVEIDDALEELRAPRKAPQRPRPGAPAAEPADSPLGERPTVAMPPAQPKGSIGRFVAVFAALLAIIVGGLWLVKMRPQPPPAETARPAENAPAPFTGHTDEVLSVAFSADGTRVASGSSDKTLKLWDVATGTGLRTFTGHRGKVNAVAFSPNGRWIASASDDKTVKLWDKDSEGLRSLVGHTGVVSALAFSPDGKSLATAGEDRNVKLWDVAAGREIRSLAGHTDWIRAVAFSPDGKWVASAGDDRLIKIWDTAEGKEARSLPPRARGVSSLSFSPGGQLLGSGTWKALELWDTTSGVLQTTLMGHTSWVSAVAFSPDGKIVATGSGDQTIKLWDLNSGRELRALRGHTRGVSAAAFSRDGRLLVSGSWDKTAKIWEAESGKELRTLTDPIR